MLIIYLFIATLVVFIGAAIALISRGSPILLSAIRGFTTSTVLGILFLQLLPHFYEHLGFPGLLVVGGSFLLVFLIERLTHQASQPASKEHLWVADLTLVGLLLHELTDGFNLVIAAQNEQLGPGLAFATLVHRLPFATALTRAFLKNHSIRATLGRLSPMAIAPVIGVLIGERALSGAFGKFAEYLTAFAGGTLLHILIHEFKGNYALNRSDKLVGGIAFIVGLVVIVLAVYNGVWGHAH